MELLERGSLDDRIARLGKLPQQDVLDIGVQIAILVSGSVVLERIFGLPGLGLMLIEAVT